MGKVWIDVTTTMNWNRPAVGILRVEQELIKYALSKKDNVRFFIYENQHFSELEPKIVQEKVYYEYSEKKNNLKGKEQIIVKKSGKLGFSLRRLRNSVFFFFKSIYEFFMAFTNDDAYNHINHMNHIHYQVFKQRLKTRIKRLLFKKPKQETIKQEITDQKLELNNNFNDGDVIMSIGLSWDHGGKFRDFYTLKKRIDVKVIAMCYDLIPIKFPNLFLSLENASNFERYYDSMTWASDAVACISKSSQKDYVGWLNDKFMPEPVTKVVTLGSTIKSHEVERLSQSVKDIDQKFILFVSTIERRKNHESIIKAIQYLIDQGSENIPLVVFVGMRGWGVDDMLNDYDLNSDLQRYIKILNHLGDDDLSYLYQNCEFFLYPSFYEGWGLPVAEGLTYGKFGICSMTSSIPEVGGDLLDYVYPYDVIGWANRIEQYMQYPEQLKVKEDRVRDEFNEYTWNNFGSQMFEIAESIVDVK